MKSMIEGPEHPGAPKRGAKRVAKKVAKNVAKKAAKKAAVKKAAKKVMAKAVKKATKKTSKKAAAKATRKIIVAQTAAGSVPVFSSSDRWVPLDSLIIDENLNPRVSQAVESATEPAEDIEEFGQRILKTSKEVFGHTAASHRVQCLQLPVVGVNSGDTFTVIDGRRRIRAIQSLGLKDAEVLVTLLPVGLDPAALGKIAYAGFDRKGLNPVQIAIYGHTVVRSLLENQLGRDPLEKEIAKWLGMSVATWNNTFLPLARTSPDIQRLVGERAISVEVFRANKTVLESYPEIAAEAARKLEEAAAAKKAEQQAARQAAQEAREAEAAAKAAAEQVAGNKGKGKGKGSGKGSGKGQDKSKSKPESNAPAPVSTTTVPAQQAQSIISAAAQQHLGDSYKPTKEAEALNRPAGTAAGTVGSAGSLGSCGRGGKKAEAAALASLGTLAKLIDVLTDVVDSTTGLAVKIKNYGVMLAVVRDFAMHGGDPEELHRELALAGENLTYV